MILVTNASEAIGDRDGVIRVTARVVSVGGDWPVPALERLPEGDYLQLEVSDTGCGMTTDMQARVFDPFFTTSLQATASGLRSSKGPFAASTGPSGLLAHQAMRLRFRSCSHVRSTRFKRHAGQRRAWKRRNSKLWEQPS